ncbi:IS3 family transposase [Sphingobacterium sp. SRCM116780]|uniref:IS3 family transposase n=1 Tax=Sphingobacterium sp. SRCM116780 TaxID=2907623 RepID=UPI001F3B7FE9|nr:IS3 family transposase [Sphingobacterium sp. SRCM116780]UIR54711.1 IS3 family transposase [Sphingobacterium sp. SRCM116780]UIR55219.1 IS3 family transposase [Sphingobacterium sp. SRCM116780]UIR55729.1 IS3 family transposase [Sphingobacterium sp. SRCM116780]UIR55941.1 IS3 family transposase [Sphingobacterium sp. SRCM116780]UIR56016.1 IS3 family transposase [Sphingobacterium sp. SRCM116780]
MKEIFINIPLSTICSLFGRTRQSWYEMNARRDVSVIQDGMILEWVREIRSVLPRTGCVKLLHMLQQNLKAHHITIGRDAFSRLIRDNGMLIYPKRRYVTTTMSYHHYRKWPDMISRAKPLMAEQVWVSDITYLRTGTGFIYLFLITDAYSRKIVGYHLSQSLKASGCLSALQKAINGREYKQRPLIHHSDRGIQYCCDAYVELLQRNHIQISMTQSGSPYDNAIAERVNGILKTEFELYNTFESYSMAIEPVCRAIERYNNVRPHMSCKMMTPAQRHSQEITKTRNSTTRL